MGLFDKLRKKAGETVDQHGDKIEKGLDRAAAEADKRTGGKHADKIAKGREQARQQMDKLGDDGDQTPPSEPPRQG